jgi:hypothetical protein
VDKLKDVVDRRDVAVDQPTARAGRSGDFSLKFVDKLRHAVDRRDVAVDQWTGRAGRSEIARLESLVGLEHAIDRHRRNIAVDQATTSARRNRILVVEQEGRVVLLVVGMNVAIHQTTTCAGRNMIASLGLPIEYEHAVVVFFVDRHERSVAVDQWMVLLSIAVHQKTTSVRCNRILVVEQGRAVVLLVVGNVAIHQTAASLGLPIEHEHPIVLLLVNCHSGSIAVDHGLVLLPIAVYQTTTTSSTRRNMLASIRFLIEHKHAVVLLVVDRHGKPLAIDHRLLRHLHLNSQLLWVAGQYHPIEERNAVGGRNGKRRRAVRREVVQRALDDSFGDAIEGVGEGSV